MAFMRGLVILPIEEIHMANISRDTHTGDSLMRGLVISSLEEIHMANILRDTHTGDGLHERSGYFTNRRNTHGKHFM